MVEKTWIEMDRTPTLQHLVRFARQAGELLMSGFGNTHQIGFKGDIDLVTEVDRNVEASLISNILEEFPAHSIIAEESGTHGTNSRHKWYIDPLDGTVNYAHGVPIFCVSIAYAEEDEVRLGVVYNPVADECFRAERGKGAWINDKAVCVSQTRRLAESLLVTGFPYDTWDNPINNLDHFARFTLISQGVRRLGSAALDLCFVAAGRLDGYWEIRLEPWDVAAGTLICQEAGGIVTNVSGDPDVLSYPQSIVAANPVLHPLILSLLQNRLSDQQVI